jgi:hypothetical protein
MTMRSAVGGDYGLLLFLVACAGHPTRATLPAPAPIIPRPDSGATTARTWSFSYEAGIARYDIKRTATIEDQSDSVKSREVAVNRTHESLALERIGDTIRVTITADTFATTAQDLPASTPSIALPVHLAASLIQGELQIVADSSVDECNPAQSALRSDLHNLIMPFPPQLSRGMTWRDSVELKSCQAMIPITANVDRSYSVTGDAVYAGIPVVVVERRDIIRAHGEGAQQQHRIIIDAGGTGKAIEYLSASGGRIIAATTTQELSLTITASGRDHHFKQRLEQELALSP